MDMPEKGTRAIAAGTRMGRTLVETRERSDEHWTGAMEVLGTVAVILQKYARGLMDKRQVLDMEFQEQTFGLLRGISITNEIAPELAIRDQTILLDAAFIVGLAQGIMDAAGLEQANLAIPQIGGDDDDAA